MVVITGVRDEMPIAKKKEGSNSNDMNELENYWEIGVVREGGIKLV